MALQQHHAGGGNWFARLLIGVLVVICSAIVAVLAFRTSIVAFGLTQLLNQAGLGPATVSVPELGTRRTVIGPIRIGSDDLTIASIEVEYSLSDALLRNSVDILTIQDVDVRGSWTEDGVSFGALDRIANLSSLDSQTGSTDVSDGTGNIGQITLTDVSIQVLRPDGLITAAGDLQLILDGTTTELNAAAEVQGPGIEGSVRWSGTVRNGDLLGSIGSGGLRVNITDLTVPGFNQTINGNGTIDVALADRTLTVEMREPLNLSAPWPEDDFFGQELAKGQRIKVSIGSGSEATALLKIEDTPDGIRGSAAMEAKVTLPLGSGSAALDGWAQFGDSAMPQDFGFDRLQLEVAGMPTPYGTASATIKAGGFAGPIAVAQGPVEVLGTLKNGIVSGISVSELTLDSETLFRLDGLSLSFDVKTLDLTAASVAYPNVARIEDELHVFLVQDMPNAQTTTLVFGADGTATVTFDVGVGLEGGPLTLRTGDTETEVLGRFPAISAVGYWAGEDGLNVDVEVAGGTVDSPYGKLTALRTNLASTGSGVEGTVLANVTLDRTRASSRPGLPMNATFSLADGSIRAEGDLELRQGLKLASVKADYDIAREGGRLNADIGPLVFGGEGVGPSDIAPLALPATVRSGDVFANVTVPLGKAQGPNEGSVLIRDLDVDLGDYRFDRVNAAIALDRAWPLEIISEQELAIGLLQAGVPLTDVLAIFSMPNPDQVDVSNLTMDFAGGRIAAENARLVLAGESTISFDVSGVNLTDLATLSGLEGLQADGLLSGTIPVRLTGGDAVVTNGILSAHGPGKISYRTAATAAAASDGASGYGLALRALEDFRYDALTVSVNGSLSESLEVGLQIKGRNPTVYDGYPIDFNLNLSGELANVIRGSLTGYRVPETIRRQLTDFPSSQR